MEDKEKQIKEMTEFLQSYSDIDKSYYDGEWQPVNVYSGLAKTLYHHDFRIIAKDNVVLSREEYTELQKLDDKNNETIRELRQKILTLSYELENKGKEIAENIYKEARIHFGEMNGDIKTFEKWLQNQFGIEIKEQ